MVSVGNPDPVGYGTFGIEIWRKREEKKRNKQHFVNFFALIVQKFSLKMMQVGKFFFLIDNKVFFPDMFKIIWVGSGNGAQRSRSQFRIRNKTFGFTIGTVSDKYLYRECKTFFFQFIATLVCMIWSLIKQYRRGILDFEDPKP